MTHLKEVSREKAAVGAQAEVGSQYVLRYLGGEDTSENAAPESAAGQELRADFLLRLEELSPAVERVRCVEDLVQGVAPPLVGAAAVAEVVEKTAQFVHGLRG